ncbi:MAG: valine--tRNA ligase [Gemmatimonadetes bacterium]|nr:valine--tRNA ligase [Gemmatimonadota bacterium]
MTTTQLAPQFDPAAIESTIYQRWLDAGVFTADVTSGREPYVIVIPPPNVTSVLHMGHGLDVTFQDLMIRFERMRGREALWLPGTDHAGIATQNVVERLIATEGQTRHDLGRDAFERRVWDHVKHTGGKILDQLKAVGASCDWSRTRFTLDEAYSAAVRQAFVQLYDEGLLYRGFRVIHWCPRCLTSLSDEEAEFHDRAGKMYHIKYPLADGSGYATVATTRPETMFGDVCLVRHPDDERYAALTAKSVRIPLTDVEIPIDVSTAVERELGTGMLKVTPAHDANDFDIANELDRGFDRPVVIDEHARMVASERVPQALHGLDRDAARKKLLELLDAEGFLEKVEPYQHAVRQCYRCNTVVEPRLSDQWFVRMKSLAEPALQAYRDGKIRFVPDRWGKVYENWLNEIRDWNISRQLWWGHRIPAWYCEADGCGKIIVSQRDEAECECGGTLRQDEDVLDTWFSSWLWPLATFGWPEETEDLKRFYPGHTLVTGPDIIFFWVARMIMAGYHFMGDRPFHTVYLHGIVRDPQHRKMSKSLGNGIDPLDVIERFGADALRFTSLAGAATGQDIIMHPDDLDTSFAVGRNFANKIWNVARFVLSNLDGPLTPRDELESADLELADRWILSRLQRTIGSVTEHLHTFRMNDAATGIYQFFWGELADWYVEQVKPRLYGDVPGGEHARGCLLVAFEDALRLLHPMMPFITEELWGYLPGGRDRGSLLAAEAWPETVAALADDEAEATFAAVQALVTAIRTIRAEYGVKQGQEIGAHVEPASAQTRAALEAERGTISRLAKVDVLSFETPKDSVGGHAVLPDGSAVFVPLGNAIDVAAECERLQSEVDRLETQLQQVTMKLRNEKFTARAPAEVVERERRKEQAWREQRDTLAAKRGSLGC